MIGKHINIVDSHLRVVAEAAPHPEYEMTFLLYLELFYDNTRAGNLEFTLQGYSQDEAQRLVRSIKDNAFLLKEIDDFLCGDEM